MSRSNYDKMMEKLDELIKQHVNSIETLQDMKRTLQKGNENSAEEYEIKKVSKRKNEN